MREFNGGVFGTYGSRAPSLDMLDVLLRYGTDSAPLEAPMDKCLSLLMNYAFYGDVKCVARLLQDPRARATVNTREFTRGSTALHMACSSSPEKNTIVTVRLLLQAGANPFAMNKQDKTPLDALRQEYPSHRSTIALLEQYPEAKDEAEKASFLVKVRRFVVAATSTTQSPSYVQARVARAQPLPQVAKRTNSAKVLGSLCQLGGGKGLPDGVFLHVLDYVMPSWDPLRTHPRFAKQLLVPGLKKA